MMQKTPNLFLVKKKATSELHQEHLSRPSIQKRTPLDKTHLDVVRGMNLAESFQPVRQ